MVFTSPFSLSRLSEFLVHVHQNFQVDLDSFPNIGYVYSNNASLIFLSRILYIYKLIFLSLVCIVCCSFFSFTKKPRRSGPAVCRYVELCYDPLGACDERSSIWKPVTYGSWHEGWWNHLSPRVMRIKILLVSMSMLGQSVCHKNLGHDHAQFFYKFV